MSYKKYAPNDIVISFGENNYSQTAQENSDLIMNPRIIYSLLNKKIKKIFSGYNYNFGTYRGYNEIISKFYFL